MRGVRAATRQDRGRASAVACAAVTAAVIVLAAPGAQAHAAGGATFLSSEVLLRASVVSFGVDVVEDIQNPNPPAYTGQVTAGSGTLTSQVQLDQDVVTTATTDTFISTASWTGTVDDVESEASIQVSSGVGIRVATAADWKLTASWDACGGATLTNLMTSEVVFDKQPPLDCSGGVIAEFVVGGTLGPADYFFSVATNDASASGGFSGELHSAFELSPSPCTIVGTSEGETLTGTSGNDVICGLAGADTINAGGGNDVVFGGLGSDTINGAAGIDSLLGGDGGDTINGGADADRVFGGTGADTLRGDDANDLVVGGPSDDSVIGGAGKDTLVGCTQSDSFDGGIGDDTITGGYPTQSDAALLTGVGAQLDLRTVGAVASDVGCNARPTNDGRDRVSAGAGNDTIATGTEDDLVIGGDGDDTIRPGAGRDLTTAGPGDDLVIDDAGVDRVAGCAGDDTITGGRDNDLLSGGKPLPGFFPGSGTVVFGADARTCAADTAGAKNSVDGGSGDDEVDGDVLSRDTLLGGSGVDSLNGQGAADVLKGGTGNDTLRGGPGTDVLKGEVGRDLLIANDSTKDTVDGGPDPDRARIDAGIDVVSAVETIL